MLAPVGFWGESAPGEPVLELGRLFLSEQQAWHFQLCSCLYSCPLHAHIKSDNAVLLLQLPAADNFSRINVCSTISKVLDKWFQVPTQRGFQQSLSTDERCHQSEASCLWRGRGTLACRPVWPPLWQDGPQSAARSRAHTSCCCLVAQSCPTLCDPMDCGLTGSFAYGISQARILQWAAISSSRGSSQSSDPTSVSCLAGRFFITETPELSWGQN